MFVCSQLDMSAHTKILCEYAALCYIPAEHTPTSGARVVLVPQWGKSGIGRLFASCLTFSRTPCKAVLEGVPEPVEGRGFKPKIFDKNA